jgi:hypothetical protein
MCLSGLDDVDFHDINIQDLLISAGRARVPFTVTSPGWLPSWIAWRDAG